MRYCVSVLSVLVFACNNNVQGPEDICWNTGDQIRGCNMVKYLPWKTVISGDFDDVICQYENHPFHVKEYYVFEVVEEGPVVVSLKGARVSNKSQDEKSSLLAFIPPNCNLISLAQGYDTISHFLTPGLYVVELVGVDKWREIGVDGGSIYMVSVGPGWVPGEDYVRSWTQVVF